jgi:pilus assembly protein FimV
VHRSIIRAFLFLFVLTSSFAVHATGLGNLTLNSYLGQPFKAEIDIVSVKKEDIPSLSVKLASRETFRQSNVDYAPFLFTFRISIENRANGQPYVKITSPQRVVEPFLSMLIELNWSSGRLIREYTVLLDPPEDALEPALPAVQVEPVVPSSVKPEPAAAEQPDSIIVENVVSEEEPTVKEVAPEPEKVPEQVPEPEQKTVSAEQPETTYGPVKSGDTLAKIAQKVAHPRVQLNQMLIALHRANRKAFSDNNMNRLKAGPILRIPDASEVATISPDAADKEVKMQTANWEAYRQKLAAEVDSATSSADEESAQTATGKISTMIEDKLADDARKQPKDKLNISPGEGAEGGKGENTTSGAQDKIRALEESATAKEKTLNEANERVAILEKNVKELQQLLELKNAEMAELQNQAEPITSDATTETKLPPTITEESSADGEGSAQEDEESSTTEAPAAETAEPSPKAVPASPPMKKALPVVVEGPSMMDSIGPVIDSVMENIEYVGAALLLLLIGVFAINRKKKAAVNDIDLDEGEDEDPSDTTDTSRVTGVGVKQADDYDPVVEAGQYLDHGRDVQAEKILKEALAKDQSNPEFLAKLLEVHTQRKDKSAFETTARKLWSVSPTGPLWEKAAKLGLSIDPENPFYGGVASTNIDQVKPNEEVSDESFVTSSDSVETPVNTPKASEPVNDEPDFGINFNSSEEDENDSGNVATIDFPVSDDTKDIDDTSMDFPDVSESEEATPAPVLPEADLADINLNIDDSVPAEPVDTQSVEKSTQWHEIATKIDLARAYQEMGDNDGAKEILQEVLKDGDSEQQESAKAILESL